VEKTQIRLRHLSKPGQIILGFSIDVTDRGAVSAMMEEIISLKLSVNRLVCNAGVIGPIEKFLETDFDKWIDSFNINLFGTLNIISEVLPNMLREGTGKIVHVSGGGATSPLPGMTSYAASKIAAVRFIESLAVEYQDTGVSFNSVAPGMLKTKLLDQMLEAGAAKIGDRLFEKSTEKARDEFDSTEKAIALIEFLTSAESNGITGKLISAEWDNWREWPMHLETLQSTDVYTLRRVTGRDRGASWGDL